MSKQIKLKNNKLADLHLEKDGCDFFLYATSTNGDKIAYCTFSLYFKIEKTLTFEEKLKYSKKHKITLEKVPEKLYKILDNEKDFKICNNFIKLKNGKVYTLSETVCELAKIEILNKNYFKVGLGSYLLKTMENIIAKYNCSHIEGIYAPFGQFQCGTEEFYDRNNFEIIKDPALYGLKQIYKKYKPKTSNLNI